MIRRLVAALALALAAASGAAAQDAPNPPAFIANPPLATVPLALTARGRVHRYTVEVARTPVEQQRGLMQRRTMARAHGMIFPFDPPREAAFWMEGTILPLDIIFVTSDHKIGRIAANAVPFDRTDIPSRGITAAVLELNAGEAARIGLKAGDAVGYALDAMPQAR